MKKLISLLLVLMLAGTAFAELTFTTGGAAGTYYAFGGVLAKYVSENTDLDITAVTSGGSQDNIERLDMGMADLAFSQSDVAYCIYNGIRYEDYLDDPITGFSALAALYDETVQLITTDPEIKSMADLKGKSVSIGDMGSGVYYNALDYLAAYDMTVEDIKPQYLSFADSADSLKDGKIVAAFVVAGAPTPAVVDLCATKEVYLVNVDDEHIAKLSEINGAYTKCIIPAGTYSGIDTDTVTVSVKAIVLAGENITDDEAYAIVSTIFENKEAISQAHAKGEALDLEYAAVCGLPYHKGAAKYFAEKGITVEVAE